MLKARNINVMIMVADMAASQNQNEVYPGGLAHAHILLIQKSSYGISLPTL